MSLRLKSLSSGTVVRGRALLRLPCSKRDLSHLDLAPGRNLPRLRDSFCDDAARAERALAAHFTSDSERAMVHRLCTEAEWRHRIVLDGASYVDVRGWGDVSAYSCTDKLVKDFRLRLRFLRRPTLTLIRERPNLGRGIREGSRKSFLLFTTCARQSGVTCRGYVEALTPYDICMMST